MMNLMIQIVAAQRILDKILNILDKILNIRNKSLNKQ